MEDGIARAMVHLSGNRARRLHVAPAGVEKVSLGFDEIRPLGLVLLTQEDDCSK